MNGKSLQAFIEGLYYNPEIELVYNSKRYFISGYVNDDGTLYTLEVFCIDENRAIFFVENKSREYCVESFKHSCIFDGGTVYDVEKDITVLYG
jgi:hypothetical protein